MWYENIQDVGEGSATLLEERASIHDERDLASVEPTELTDKTRIGVLLCMQIVSKPRIKFDVQPLVSEYDIKERVKRFLTERGYYVSFSFMMRGLRYKTPIELKIARQALRSWVEDDESTITSITLSSGTWYGLREWQHSQQVTQLRQMVKGYKALFSKELHRLLRASQCLLPYGNVVKQLVQEGRIRIVRKDLYYVQDPDTRPAQTPEEVTELMLEILTHGVAYHLRKIAEYL